MTFRLLPLALALLASAAPADVLKDPQWQAWLDTGKTAELTRAARAKGDDEQATLALAMAAIDDNDAARLEASVAPLQACVDRRPASASSPACHYALGRVYGQQAMTASVFKMPGLAAKTKEQFVKAVALDPQFFEARMGLAQFYLIAPGFAGGSTSKARELAADAQAHQPEHAKLLRFLVAAQADDLAGAERELASVKPGDDRALQREHAAGPYGLARVALETAQPEEAVRLLERARTLEGAERYPIDQRLGQALAAKGDKPGARAALERFLQNRRANPRNIEDARKLLASLA